MKHKQGTEEQIISILKAQEAGCRVADEGVFRGQIFPCHIAILFV